jgi:hypothetical protein
MVAVNGKGYTQREESRASEEGPKEGLPIMKTLFTPYTQGPERVEERLNVAELYRMAPFLGQTIIPQKSDKTSMEMARGINVSYDVPVSFHESLVTHLGDEVYGKISVVPPGLSYNPAFLLQPFVEPCAFNDIQKAYHSGDYPALLDEIYLPLKDSRGIAIETNDEPP